MTIRLRNTLSTPKSLTREYLARVFLVSPNGAPTLIATGAALPTEEPIVEAIGIVSGSDLQYTTTAIPENDEITPTGTFYQITETYGYDTLALYQLIPLSGFVDNTIVVVSTVLSGTPGNTGSVIREAPVLQSTASSADLSNSIPVLPGGFNTYLGNLILNHNTDDPAQFALYLCTDASPVTWVKLLDSYSRATANVTLIPTPRDGEQSYQTSNDNNEGLYLYNGTSWRRPWNMPWGEVAYSQTNANQLGISAITDLTNLSVTWTAVANRKYLVTSEITVEQNTGAGRVLLTMADGSNVAQDTAYFDAQSVDDRSRMTITHRDIGLSAGSQTRKMRLQTDTNTVDVLGSSVLLSFILVEDIGPNGAPT